MFLFTLGCFLLVLVLLLLLFYDFPLPFFFTVVFGSTRVFVFLFLSPAGTFDNRGTQRQSLADFTEAREYGRLNPHEPNSRCTDSQKMAPASIMVLSPTTVSPTSLPGTLIFPFSSTAYIAGFAWRLLTCGPSHPIVQDPFPSQRIDYRLSTIDASRLIVAATGSSRPAGPFSPFLFFRLEPCACA
ncbi:uncharacterized protein EI97DRAFT_212987 [Westerdykella ornata]|uniref:Uncharacterized protein n=1 Tax=Westerdykella ornata TaxID=318751 RepID=A0A6A6J8Q8_WESOR|nr:uncharacterized protein EI97DRAFT_212987 [Westerdykella ornata]KAF2272388.1 hypothetical protein EI97DRAFT_212987 [Westerdykella ornata]